MDNKDDVRQHLLAQKETIKKTILEKLTELHFLRNNGLMCEYPVWLTKEKYSTLISNTEDDVILDDQKFSQLLNRPVSVDKVEERILKKEKQKQDLDLHATEDDTTNNSSATIERSAAKELSNLEPNSTNDDVPMEVDETIEDNNKSTSELTKIQSKEPEQTSTKGESEVKDVSNDDSNKLASIEVNKVSKEFVESKPITGENSTILEKNQKEQQINSTLTQVKPAEQYDVSESSQKPKNKEEVVQKEKESRLESENNKSQSDSYRTELLKEQSNLSPTRISKVVEPTITSAENHQKQIFERAKHEAAVTSRIAELRKQGLWSAKRLPKLQEPPRPKTHWDYLLEEMRWLSSDFDAERKWKRKAAKKCALMVYRYHQEKRSKIERAEKEHLQHIKRVAAAQAKEIRSFWSSIEKIVDFRQQTKLEETRKKAWGLHLNYILDQTSKFSNTCLEDNNKSQSTTKEESMEIDNYLTSQDGENKEKEPVIKVSILLSLVLH